MDWSLDDDDGKSVQEQAQPSGRTEANDRRACDALSGLAARATPRRGSRTSGLNNDGGILAYTIFVDELFNPAPAVAESGVICESNDALLISPSCITIPSAAPRSSPKSSASRQPVSADSIRSIRSVPAAAGINPRPPRRGRSGSATCGLGPAHWATSWPAGTCGPSSGPCPPRGCHFLVGLCLRQLE